MKKDINSNKKKIITTIIIILVSLIMIVCIFMFFRNYQITKKEIGATESKASTITIGEGSFVTEEDHNNEVSNSHQIVTKRYEFTALPDANTASMIWNISSIPNYQSLVLYKNLFPYMNSDFDMSNWNTSLDRSWNVYWSYSSGNLIVSTKGGPEVQYGTGRTYRTVTVYVLE